MSPHCASRSTPMTSIILVWKPASGVRSRRRSRCESAAATRTSGNSLPRQDLLFFDRSDQLADQLTREVAVDIFGAKSAWGHQVGPDSVVFAVLHFDRQKTSVDRPGVTIQVANPRIASEIALDVGITLAGHDEIGGRWLADQGDAVFFSSRWTSSFRNPAAPDFVPSGSTKTRAGPAASARTPSNIMPTDTTHGRDSPID